MKQMLLSLSVALLSILQISSQTWIKKFESGAPQKVFKLPDGNFLVWAYGTPDPSKTFRQNSFFLTLSPEGEQIDRREILNHYLLDMQRNVDGTFKALGANVITGGISPQLFKMDADLNIIEETSLGLDSMKTFPNSPIFEPTNYVPAGLLNQNGDMSIMIGRASNVAFVRLDKNFEPIFYDLSFFDNYRGYAEIYEDYFENFVIAMGPLGGPIYLYTKDLNKILQEGVGVMYRPFNPFILSTGEVLVNNETGVNYDLTFAFDTTGNEVTNVNFSTNHPNNDKAFLEDGEDLYFTGYAIDTSDFSQYSYLRKTNKEGGEEWKMKIASEWLHSRFLIKENEDCFYAFGSKQTTTNAVFMVKISAELSSTIEQEKPTDLLIFPNPVNTYLNIKSDEIPSGDLSVTIFDMLGKQVFKTETNVSAGQNSVEIDLSGFHQKGHFNFQLNSEGSKQLHGQFMKN